MVNLKVTALPAEQAVKLDYFKSLCSPYGALRVTKDGNYYWDTSKFNADVLRKLLLFHFPILRDDASLLTYSLEKQGYINLADPTKGEEQLKRYVLAVKEAYSAMNGSALPAKEVSGMDIPSAKAPHFAPWDGVPRAFDFLDGNFFDLDPDAILADASDEMKRENMKLGFIVWAVQHVAHLKGRGDHARYSLIPLLLSNDRNIGKSTMLMKLLSQLGDTNQTTWKRLLDSTTFGRDMANSAGLIIDEIGSGELKKNFDTFKNYATTESVRSGEKYERERLIQRETAIIATSNQPSINFKLREPDRRLLLLPVKELKSVDDRVEFDDYPFDQFWAEIAWHVDQLDDMELTKMAQWGADDMIQVPGDEETIVFRFLQNEVVNELFKESTLEKSIDNMEKDAFYDEIDKTSTDFKSGKDFVTLSDNKSTAYVTSKYIYRALYTNPALATDVLEALNVKYMLNDGKLIFKERSFILALRQSFLGEFVKRTGQLKERMINGSKKFVISSQVTDDSLFQRAPLNTKSQGDKLALFLSASTNDNKLTKVQQSIVNAKAWELVNVEYDENATGHSKWTKKPATEPDEHGKAVRVLHKLDELNPNEHQMVAINPKAFNGRLVVIDLDNTRIEDLPNDLAKEASISGTGSHVFIWLDNYNYENLAGSFELKLKDCEIYEGNHAISTHPENWINEIEPNRGIGFLVATRQKYLMQQQSELIAKSRNLRAMENPEALKAYTQKLAEEKGFGADNRHNAAASIAGTIAAELRHGKVAYTEAEATLIADELITIYPHKASDTIRATRIPLEKQD